MKASIVAAVGIGGGLGAIARFLLSSLIPATVFNNFPLPILTINILGCLLLGMFVEIFAIFWTPSEPFNSFLTTGFLGGFTTFSAFSLEYGLLINRGLSLWANLYAVLSCLFSLSAFFIGNKIVKYLV